MLYKKENNDNYNYILKKCEEYLSVHMGKVDTIVYKKEGRAIITLKVPFLIFSNEILEFLNEAKDKIQNMLIFPFAGRELSIKISVDYFDSGE